MDEKKFAKSYILSMLALYFIGAVFLFLLLFFLSNRNDVNNALSLGQVIGISLLLPLLPCASFTGFCMVFKKTEEFKARQKIALCVFFPITLVLITVYGFFMIMPAMLKSIKTLTT